MRSKAREHDSLLQVIEEHGSLLQVVERGDVNRDRGRSSKSENDVLDDS